MDYFFHLPHLSAPSSSIVLVVRASREETCNCKSWKRIGQDALRAHCRGCTWDTHPENLLRKIHTAYAPCLMFFIWRKLKKSHTSLNNFAKGQHWFICEKIACLSHRSDFLPIIWMLVGLCLAVSCSLFPCLHTANMDRHMLDIFMELICFPWPRHEKSPSSPNQEES